MYRAPESVFTEVTKYLTVTQEDWPRKNKEVGCDDVGYLANHNASKNEKIRLNIDNLKSSLDLWKGTFCGWYCWRIGWLSRNRSWREHHTNQLPSWRCFLSEKKILMKKSKTSFASIIYLYVVLNSDLISRFLLWTDEEKHHEISQQGDHSDGVDGIQVWIALVWFSSRQGQTALRVDIIQEGGVL